MDVEYVEYGGASTLPLLLRDFCGRIIDNELRLENGETERCPVFLYLTRRSYLDILGFLCETKCFYIEFGRTAASNMANPAYPHRVYEQGCFSFG